MTQVTLGISRAIRYPSKTHTCDAGMGYGSRVLVLKYILIYKLENKNIEKKEIINAHHDLG